MIESLPVSRGHQEAEGRRGASTSRTTRPRCATSPRPASRSSATISCRCSTGRGPICAIACPSGGTCMRFDIYDFAVFDIHLLEPCRRGRGLSATRSLTKRRRRLRGDERGRRRRRLREDHHHGAAWLDRDHDDGSRPGASQRVRRHLARSAPAAFHRFSRGDRAGRRGGRHPDVLPSRRSAVLAARAAAHHVDGRRLRDDPRRGGQPRQRHDALLGLARRAAGQRPAGDHEAVRAEGAFPPPPQRQARRA